MTIEGRVVLITGAAGGIGRVLCKMFSELGDRVAGIDVVEPLKIHGTAITLQADVTNSEQIEHSIEKVIQTLGPIDVLINNAGAADDTPFEKLTHESWDHDVQLVLRGNYLTQRYIIPHMVKQGKGGSIVNIGSVNGHTYLGSPAYSAAKAGLENLTKALAVRYGPLGIRVNVCAPGTVWSPAWDERVKKHPDINERMKRWYPVGRLGTPEDVSRAVIFLADSKNSFITGTTLYVDGGLLAGNPCLIEDIYSENNDFSI
ncbi:3-oxoacyl-[acyl-carrier-protein]reductase [Schizosaccharomyces osmophilus]|uniref:3-oxoacyl-[acyl-carrier-protein]reductase n=1 Tax=Schizosaccharomyces osmophilus TaxID=2545709 RepID=A0AAF0AS22_9SCHI|nr:3-oxoacyl-[acyl-carrier-protein]reductase [Schizosaccharomyces osmophilus]WBW70786.1 3-oxoacyl-[acyl-carrier-protein]reductase [Schizosaccharomyces osmophilus]